MNRNQKKKSSIQMILQEIFQTSSEDTRNINFSHKKVDFYCISRTSFNSCVNFLPILAAYKTMLEQKFKVVCFRFHH